MADEQTGQERTEDPTERRKMEARRKGQVPRSRELNTMLSLLLMGIGLLVLGGPLVEGLFAVTRAGFSVEREVLFEPRLLPVHLMHMITGALTALAPFFALAIVAALAGPLVMGGWSFSLEALAFKLEKLDPVKGLGRIFSAKGLVELLKALSKFTLLLSATYLLFLAVQDDVISLSALSVGDASERAVGLLLTCLLVLSCTMGLIAMVDVPFELWNFHRQLKMTHQEVRDEMKETEGRPEVRQRIRNLQRQASQRRMMQDVPDADVVITNPTHYAVALCYASGGQGAPTVVARGRDRVAQRIRSIALDNDVPIYEEPLLARALYANTELGDEIPRNLYLAVARVLAYLFQLRRSRPTDYVPRPDSLDIPEEYNDLMDEDTSDG
ncbi:MAG: flagellar biosynthetic protein FlhB [Halieaceae bacterium]